MTTDTTTVAETPALKAVFYTDGGCKPKSRGNAGWGVHGYTYLDEPAKQGTGNPKALPTPEGYSMGAGGKPTITLVEYFDAFGGAGQGTNNSAEIHALIQAFKIILERQISHTLIRPDSNYVIDGTSKWMYNWQRDDFKKDGSDRENAELWRQVFALAEEIKAAGYTYEFKHVKGHSGEQGNELADRHASKGVVAAYNQCTTPHLQWAKAQGYWKTNREHNRLLGHPTWFFATQNCEPHLDSDGRTIYFTGNIREEHELWGKAISDASFAILYLKTPDAALERVREEMARMGQDRYQGMLMCDMRVALNPEFREFIEEYPEQLLLRDQNHVRLLVPNHQNPLAWEIRPPLLAYNAVEAYRMMDRMYQEYRSNSPKVARTDVTDILYETVAAKKPKAKKAKSKDTSDDTIATAESAEPSARCLNSAIKTGTRLLKIKAGYITANGDQGEVELPITLDHDTPDRNTMAAIASPDMKVTLITWTHSAEMLWYAMVFESGEDSAIWMQPYSSMKMLPPPASKS